MTARRKTREQSKVTHTSPPAVVTHSALIGLVLVMLWLGRRAGRGILRSSDRCCCGSWCGVGGMAGAGQQ